MRLSVSLAKGDEPVPTAPALPGAAAIREALRFSKDAVEKCYGVELADHPTLGGPMDLNFRILHSGEVVEVAEGDPHFSDGIVTSCVLGVYRATALPPVPWPPHAPRTATDISFVYPLHFESERMP